MTTVLAEEGAAASAGIVGYVEAVSVERIVGWAWVIGSAERLRVEARLGDQAIALATADVGRDDLSANGVGDGRHGFSLSLPPEHRHQVNSLTVVAFDALGGRKQLAPPPPAAAGPDLDDIRRRLDLVVASQRVLHRNVQAALLERHQPATDAITAIASAQDRVETSLQTVELFAVRLEHLLAAASAPAAEGPSGGYWLRGLAGVSGLALVVACTALWRSLAG